MNRITTLCIITIAVTAIPSTAVGQNESTIHPVVDSIVLVRTELFGSGTGFVVGPRHVVTAEHVVSNDSRIRVEAGDQLVAAQVVASDVENDIAVLELASEVNIPPLRVRNRPLSLNETVIMAGHARGEWTATVKTGTVIGIQSDNGAVSWLRVSVPVIHGMSGGPAVDSAGEVVAVIVAVTLEDSIPTHAMLAPNHTLVKLTNIAKFKPAMLVPVRTGATKIENAAIVAGN